MAVRELVGSVRGKASSLNKEINELQIETRAKQLLKNSNFKLFTLRLSEMKNRRAPEAIFTKKHSHGGAMVEKLDQEIMVQEIHERRNEPQLGK